MNVDITERTFEFALRIIKLCKFLDKDRKIDCTLVRQLISAGTSVGANVAEAQSGQSRADFISKMSIACKEARETHYWLRLIASSENDLADRLSDIIQEANEVLSILVTIIRNTKTNSCGR